MMQRINTTSLSNSRTWLLLGALAMSACTEANSDNDFGEVLQSGLERNLEPAASSATVAEVTRANREFAFEMYHQIRQHDAGNLLFSPHSIASVLSMTYAGARGETERQMAEVLHVNLPQAQFHDANNALDLELASRAEGRDLDGTMTNGFHLKVQNALWAQHGLSFLSEYLDTLALHYGAGLRLLDFAADPESSRLVINAWVAEQTNSLITELLDPGAITPDTLLALTNTVFFEAFWAWPFDPSATTEAPFHRLDGSEVSVPMMHRSVFSVNTSGVTTDDYEAVVVQYEGYELAMVVIVPALGKFELVEAALSADFLDGLSGSMEQVSLTLSMPRFSYEASVDLRRALEELGMSVPFTAEADFSGMTGGAKIMLDGAVHKATISVDEYGTLASGASAIVGTVSAPPPMTVDIDRPFIYAVRDYGTGAILFLGRVTDPSSS